MSQCNSSYGESTQEAAKNLNRFNKKEMTIELSALLASAKRPMTADELSRLFSELAGFDFPTTNFYRSGNLEDFLSEQREFKVAQETPFKTFTANTDYKYQLLHQKAKIMVPETTATVTKHPHRPKLIPAPSTNTVSRFAGSSAAAEPDKTSFSSVFSRHADELNRNSSGDYQPVAARSSRSLAAALDKVYNETRQVVSHKSKSHGAVNRSYSRSPPSASEDETPAPPRRGSVFDEPPRAPVIDSKPLVVVDEREKKKPVAATETKKPARDFLKRLFGNIGCKLHSKFLTGDMAAVVCANKDTFGVEGEGDDLMIILKKEIGRLYMPGDAVIPTATVTDLLWLAKENCVANKKEPYDICAILHIFPTGVFVCGSLVGNELPGRMDAISQELGRVLAENKLQKVEAFEAGGFYVAPIKEYFARVVLTGMRDDGIFEALSVDYPCRVIVKADELYHIPEAFTLRRVPGNIYLAMLRGNSDLTAIEKMVEGVDAVERQMLFFGEENGIRIGDWATEDGKWFSGKGETGHGPTAKQSSDHFEIRKLAQYYNVTDHTQVLEPYASRPAASPTLFHNLFASVNSLYVATDCAEKKKELILQAKALAFTFVEGLCVAEEDVASALRLLKSINMALPPQ